MQRTAEELGRKLLEGVGQEPTRVDASERVVHVRRAITDAEALQLPPGWLEIAAVDMAGTGGHLDELAKRIGGGR